MLQAAEKATRLPIRHGMSFTRLCNLPAEWSKQYRDLGLAAAS